MCILNGVNIFYYFGCAEPSWWKWCVENKMYSCMMLFFLCNVLEGQLMSTGAFEIYFNGEQNVLKLNLYTELNTHP
jgi:hypothetical protein